MYTDNELFFPEHVIPQLADLRGPQWCQLVHRVAPLPETHEEKLAFMLMMTRLNGCATCETDSYRAMRGCAACAVQSLRRYKGPDDELLAAFGTALDDIRAFAAQHASLGGLVMREVEKQPR